MSDIYEANWVKEEGVWRCLDYPGLTFEDVSDDEDEDEVDVIEIVLRKKKRKRCSSRIQRQIDVKRCCIEKRLRSAYK
jgi:hypothetical protein